MRAATSLVPSPLAHSRLEVGRNSASLLSGCYHHASLLVSVGIDWSSRSVWSGLVGTLWQLTRSL